MFNLLKLFELNKEEKEMISGISFVKEPNQNQEYVKIQQLIHTEHHICKFYESSGKSLSMFIFNYNEVNNNHKNKYHNSKLYFDENGYLIIEFYEIKNKEGI